MKRIILILLFLFCNPWRPPADAWMNVTTCGGGVPAAATAYCTAATTCTATHPGACDQLCEDFEGATSCYAAYDSVCRSTAASLAVGSGDSIDFTTAHSGTLSCNDKGSNAAQTTITGGSHSTSFRFNGAADQTHVYGQFYVNIVSITLASGGDQTIFELSNSSGTQVALVSIHNASGVYTIRVASTGMTSITGTTSISAGTWYRIGFEADEDADTFKLYLDGAQEGSTATNFTNANTIRRYYFGSANGSKSATAMVIQYDNISMSTTALPGTCN